MKKKFMMFISPTCGPCQLFKPQVKKAAEEINAEYVEIDVSTEEGLRLADEYNITSSGQALYFDETDILKYTWRTPCPYTAILETIKNL